MSTIHLHRTSTLTPEQYIAGLTDFGPGRSRLFGNSADEYLKVHHRGLSQADVTEGSGGIWERLQYDWSNPDRAILTTLVRWHRAGFRCYWRWKSCPEGGRPQIDTELRVLIRRMSVENPLWGATHPGRTAQARV